MTDTTQAAPQVGHTPGPWRYQERADIYTHIVRAPGDRFICQLTQDRSGVAEANARLIAAAPEMVAELARPREERAVMLAALKEALPVLGRAATEEARSNLAPTGLKATHPALERLNRAQAAVARAEGRQS